MIIIIVLLIKNITNNISTTTHNKNETKTKIKNIK